MKVYMIINSNITLIYDFAYVKYFIYLYSLITKSLYIELVHLKFRQY